MDNYIATTPEVVIYIVPKANSCYDFSENGSRTRKTVFLIPHVIRHQEDCEIITWRCNWGHVCESKCHYAVAKIKNILVNP
jgi:hypothetical protein